MTGRLTILWSAAAACVLLAGCGELPGKPKEANRPVRPDQILEFPALWAANCSGCHGVDGRLGAARPMNDALYLGIADDAALTTIITDGAGALMPGFGAEAGGALTAEQIKVIVDGMRSTWGGAGAPDGAPVFRGATGDADAGASVFATHCALCHGAGGTGGPRGGSVVDPSYLALVSDGALRMAVVAGRTDLGMPDWRGPAGSAPLSETQIADVVAWLASHRVEFPGAPGLPDASGASAPANTGAAPSATPTGGS